MCLNPCIISHATGVVYEVQIGQVCVSSASDLSVSGTSINISQNVVGQVRTSWKSTLWQLYIAYGRNGISDRNFHVLTEIGEILCRKFGLLIASFVKISA